VFVCVKRERESGLEFREIAPLHINTFALRRKRDYVCVCVRVSEREREREADKVWVQF